MENATTIIAVQDEPLENQHLDPRDRRAATLRDVFKENDARTFALLVPVRQDFMDKERGEQILGCSTWAVYCKCVLGYSVSHVRNMLAKSSWNPAKKYAPKRPFIRKSTLRIAAEGNDPQHKVELQQAHGQGVQEGRKLERQEREILAKKEQEILAQKERELATTRTNDQYVQECVRLVIRTLKPLESDPLRFAEVVTSLAREIGGLGYDRLGYGRAVKAGTPLPQGEAIPL